MKIRINVDKLPEYYTVSLLHSLPHEHYKMHEIPAEHLKWLEKVMVDFHEAQNYLHTLFMCVKDNDKNNP